MKPLRENEWNRVLAWGVLLTALAAYSVTCYQLQAEIADDAYISFRFARNLAEGHGLVWNIGGERVEGYTNFLSVLLLAISHRAGLEIPIVETCLAIAASLGTVALLVWVAHRHLGGLHPWIAVVIAFFLADRITATHTVSGMETQLFVFLLAVVITLALAFVDAPSRSIALMLALGFFACVLCRPDAAVFVGGIFIALGLCHKKTGSPASHCPPFNEIWVCASIFGLLVAVYAAWKYSYFGYLLPNSFYIKSRPEQAFSLAGRRNVLEFFKHVAIRMRLFQFPILLVAVPQVPRLIKDARIRPKITLVLLPATLAAMYYSTITHEMGFAYRFSYPIYFFIVLAGAAATGVVLRVHSARIPYRALTVTLVTLIFLAMIVRQTQWDLRRRDPSFGVVYHSRIAAALAATGLEDKATIIVTAAGLIPYRTRFRHIDPVGLTDNYLSGRNPITLEQYEDYLWSQGADVYIGWEPPAQEGATSPDSDDVMHTPYVDQVLLDQRSYPLQMNHPRYGSPSRDRRRLLLHRRMKELRDRWIWLGEIKSEGLWRYLHIRAFVYVRKDSPRAEAIAASLNRIVDVRPSEVHLGKQP